jgi:penicillin-binding protein-related factor A (putative recombinase)
VDIVCDSLLKEYYLGIECKSCDFSKGQGTLNFKSRFSEGQIEKEYRFCIKTGRTGLLAVEVRLGAGKPKKTYFIPLKDVYKAWKTEGRKSLKLKEIQEYPKLDREKGKYVFTENFFKNLK